MAELAASSTPHVQPPHTQSDNIARVFYGLALAVLFGVVAYVGRGVLIPLIVAGFASFLIFTLKQTIKNGPMIGRFLPHWFCYIMAFVLIISISILFLEIIRENITALISAWPEYEMRLREISAEGIRVTKELGILPEDFIGGVEELRGRALAAVQPILGGAASTVQNLTANLVTMFLYTIFMLLERRRLLDKVNLLSSDGAQRAAVRDTMGDIGDMVRQYITVKTATNLVTAGISYGLMTLIGVDFAGFWALLIFVLNFIPIVGAVSAITLPVLLALVQPDGGGMQMALITLGLLVGAEQVMSSGIEPRLIGKSLNLSPLVILMSLAVWGSLWGFAGALLAVPITVTVMIILTQFEPTRPIAIMMSDAGNIAPIRHAPLGRQDAAETAASTA